MLFVVCSLMCVPLSFVCVLSATCCLLLFSSIVVYRVFYVGCCVLVVPYVDSCLVCPACRWFCLLSVPCCQLSAVCIRLSVVCRLVFVDCCLSFVARCFAV